MLSKFLKVENSASRGDKCEGKQRASLPSCAHFDLCFYFPSPRLDWTGVFLCRAIASHHLWLGVCAISPAIQLSSWVKIHNHPLAVIRSVIEKIRQKTRVSEDYFSCKCARILACQYHFATCLAKTHWNSVSPPFPVGFFKWSNSSTPVKQFSAECFEMVGIKIYVHSLLVYT